MTGRENPDPQPAAAGTASGGRAPAAAGTASGGRAPAAGAPNGGPFGSVKEATLQLATIEQGNLLQFAENGQFVVGAAALTPSAPCCSFPGHRCPAEAKDWVGVRAWEMLGFEMTKSFAFRYSYKGDGKTYEARAVGDLDCDGKTITYVLRGSAAGGGTATLTAPTNAD